MAWTSRKVRQRALNASSSSGASTSSATVASVVAADTAASLADSEPGHDRDASSAEAGHGLEGLL